MPNKHLYDMVSLGVNNQGKLGGNISDAENFCIRTRNHIFFFLLKLRAFTNFLRY